MSSLEIMDSGKFSGHKSNFSQTCSLLSRYLQEKGSFGDLSLGLSANFQPHASSTTATTKTLLPVIEKTGQPDSVTHGELERAPMTIFYAGQVIVFNDFPADKAKEIMDMAMATNAGTKNPNTYITTTTSMVQKPAESATNLVTTPTSNMVPCLSNSLIQQSTQIPIQPLVNDLPIARKASLARFLEKRKDRITAKAPYQTNNSVAGGTSKPAESKTWLGLAAQPPMQTQRQI